MALAVAPSTADSLRNVREVRAWWRTHHPAASLGHRLELLYTIALVGGIFGALAYGTASSALAQVVTPHSLAVFGPSLALLAVLMAMHWGAYQGPVVFSVPDIAFLLGAPLPRRALAVKRLASSLAGGAAAGTGLAAVVLVGLAGKGRSIDATQAAGLIVALAELGTICVAGAWAVERSERFEHAFRRATWPGVLTALGLAVVSGAGSAGREIAFWAGPWGWAVQSNAGPARRGGSPRSSPSRRSPPLPRGRPYEPAVRRPGNATFAAPRLAPARSRLWRALTPAQHTRRSLPSAPASRRALALGRAGCEPPSRHADHSPQHGR